MPLEVGLTASRATPSSTCEEVKLVGPADKGLQAYDSGIRPIKSS